jgi:hypothetical protein
MTSSVKPFSHFFLKTQKNQLFGLFVFLCLRCLVVGIRQIVILTIEANHWIQFYLFQFYATNRKTKLV